MRELFTRTSMAVIVAGATLFVAGCGSGGDTGNDSAANLIDSNMLIEEPGNDASAMEAAANAAEPTPVSNTGAASNEVLGDTSGGDTGDDGVESNVSGM